VEGAERWRRQAGEDLRVLPPTLARIVRCVRLSQALSDFQQRIAPHRHEPATERAYAHRS
jgi:hypothetical protein